MSDKKPAPTYVCAECKSPVEGCGFGTAPGTGGMSGPLWRCPTHGVIGLLKLRDTSTEEEARRLAKDSSSWESGETMLEDEEEEYPTPTKPTPTTIPTSPLGTGVVTPSPKPRVDGRRLIRLGAFGQP